MIQRDFLNLHSNRSNAGIGLPVLIILMIIGNIIFSIPLIILAVSHLDSDSFNALKDGNLSAAFKGTDINSNLLLAVLVFTFLGYLIPLAMVMKIIHKDRFKRLISSYSKIDWRRIFFATSIWFIFSALISVVDYYFIAGPENYVFQFDWENSILLLFLAFLLIPIQTSTEEFMFRGYLMQFLGKYFRIPLVPILISGALFGLMHIQNPEVHEHGVGWMMTYYIGVGVLLGLIVFMDNRLELALGYHAANNIFSAVFVNYENSAIPTDAFFLTKEMNVQDGILPFYIVSIILLLVFQKKYKWKNWSSLWTPLPQIKMEEEVDKIGA